MATPNTQTYQTFMTQPLPFTPLKEGEIPGIGAATIAKLKKVSEKGDGNFDVDTAAKVMGMFALFNRDSNEFADFLGTLGVRRDLADRISGSLFDKTNDFCDDEEYVASSGTLADGTSATVDNFERNKLSTKRLNDKGGVVPGLKSTTSTIERRVRSMLKALEGSGQGTLSTLQLLGLYMLMGPDFNKYLVEEVFKRTQDQRYADKIEAALHFKCMQICGKRNQPAAPQPAPLRTAGATTVVAPSDDSGAPPMGVLLFGFVALLIGMYLTIAEEPSTALGFFTPRRALGA